ncbi:hypothetical protein BDR03DRAFT_180902 [Suillus americanus]|nr:hypothetical protein BDR03DRAFT_180902 [Suillus americanus]
MPDEQQPVHVDQVVVEWTEPILLPCDPSSKVWVSVYASFELDPMLGRGEVLRTFEISIRELLDHSEKSHLILFQPRLGEVVSPCTSLFINLAHSCLDCFSLTAVSRYKISFQSFSL